MLDQFVAFLTQHRLLTPTDRALLAVSGGLDSVVMAELFAQARAGGHVGSFAVAHCHFGLRGEEADADEQFVRKLAKRYKADYFVEHFATEAFAGSAGISIQMAARTLRYEWFGQVCAREGFAAVATAHHQNDALETMLLNLTRGTGIAGLHGIPVRNGLVIRPLLFATRDQLRDVVVDKQLIWREDSSNDTNDYARNFVRHEVVPLLQQLNPNVVTTAQLTAEKVAAVERLFAATVAETRVRALRIDGNAHYLDLATLAAAPEPLAQLAALLQPYYFSYEQARAAWEARAAEAGKTFESPTHTLVKDRTALVITPRNLSGYGSQRIEADQTQLTGEGWRLTFALREAATLRISTDPNVACLDADLLQFPLALRRWQPGDWFCPLGMNQKKKISDLLIDAKVPLNRKADTWLLTSNGSVAWVVGHRVDNRFKISDKTTRAWTAHRTAMPSATG